MSENVVRETIKATSMEFDVAEGKVVMSLILDGPGDPPPRIVMTTGSREQMDNLIVTMSRAADEAFGPRKVGSYE